MPIAGVTTVVVGRLTVPASELMGDDPSNMVPDVMPVWGSRHSARTVALVVTPSALGIRNGGANGARTNSNTAHAGPLLSLMPVRVKVRTLPAAFTVNSSNLTTGNT